MTHSEPLISIVLPTYNGARYLRDSVSSVVEQTYRHWELIIVDDASTDGTPGIVQEMCAKDSRIRQIRNQCNQRLPGALNAGFAKADGEFLTWTSDDNCYLPEALSRMARTLIVDPDVDLVYGDSCKIDGDGRTMGRFPTRPWSDLPFWNPVGPCFLYRRSVMDRVGEYSVDLFLAEDYDFWLRASVGCRFTHIPETLYLYRIHGLSLTATRARQIWKAHQRALRRNLPRLKWLDRDTRSLAYVTLARKSRYLNCTADMVRHLLSAVRTSPRLAGGIILRGVCRRCKAAVL